MDKIIETGTVPFVSFKFDSSATIEAMAIRPYKGAEKVQGYTLCCYADYDNGRLYHCSVHETYEAAYKQLMTFASGTWIDV